MLDSHFSKQKFTAWGFGAKYGGVIQHCFQVGNQSELPGISGVLEGYRNVFRTGLVMSGPTVFAEVIAMAAAKGRSTQEHYRRIGKQAYTVLLILTDGAVSDVESTKKAIEAASDAPLSIVIVGIGSADFSSMRFLDDFQNDGVHGRDICQFVEFSKYREDRRALTRATLEEIPDQFVDYFYSRGIMPLPPVHGSQMSLDIDEAGEEDIDLNVDFGPDGEISLVNYDGAVYDDTKYGTSSCYVPSAPYQPSAPSSSTPYQSHFNSSYQSMSNQNSQPYQAMSAQSNQPYQSAPKPTQTYQPHVAPSQYTTAGSAPPSPQPPSSSQQAYQPPPFSQALTTPFTPPPSDRPYGSAPPSPQASYGQPASSQSSTTVPAQQQRLFHVRAPQGAYPGMQLQVQNPITGQQMLVSVPQGVASGGLFAVRY